MIIKYGDKMERNVLVELYTDFSKGERRLRPLRGQGIDVLNIRFSKEEREVYDIGDIFKMDLKLQNSAFYSVVSPNSLRDAFYCNGENKEKIQEFINARKMAQPLPPAEAPVSRVVSYSKPKDLVIDDMTWNFMMASLELGKYPFLIGPKGCGKSHAAETLARESGREYFYFDMGQAFKPKKMFVGGLIISETGATKAVRSLFFNAFTSEKPTLIFLDEITRIPHVAANYLMTILDRKQSYIYDEDSGKVYKKGKDVVFVAAGNMGSEYVSTQRLDSAFEDRFVKIQLNYLDQTKETELLLSRIKGLARSEAVALVKVANLVREANKKGTLTQSLSTRQLLDAAAYIPLGFKLKDIVNSVILNNFASTGEIQEAKILFQSL